MKFLVNSFGVVVLEENYWSINVGFEAKLHIINIYGVSRYSCGGKEWVFCPSLIK